MNNLIIIPARGGSKGIPKKNIYPVNGKPLLEYTIEAVIESSVTGDIVISTDSNEIAEVANKYSNVIVVERPKELAQDTSSTEDALLYTLDYMEKFTHKYYDTVITMQPTSPLRKASTIRDFVSQFEAYYEKYDAQLTFTESRADYWILNSEENFCRLYPDAPRRRQERKPLYVENSMLYITKTEVLKTTHSVLGNMKKVRGFIISEEEAVDINEWNDLKLAEFYIQNQ